MMRINGIIKFKIRQLKKKLFSVSVLKRFIPVSEIDFENGFKP